MPPLNDDTDREQRIEQKLVEVARKNGLSLIAVQPIYYLHPDERDLLPVLSAIDHNCLVADVPASRLPNGGNGQVGSGISHHWLSRQEMQARFADIPHRSH
jgi:DNA polymerase III alpha subunit